MPIARKNTISSSQMLSGPSLPRGPSSPACIRYSTTRSRWEVFHPKDQTAFLFEQHYIKHTVTLTVTHIVLWPCACTFAPAALYSVSHRHRPGAKLKTLRLKLHKMRHGQEGSELLQY